MTEPAWDGQSLAEELARQIEDQVVDGRLGIGTWLRQSKIAGEFGVSRTPVREAIQKLHARGVVELIPNRGARVRGPSPRDIREAYLVRAELEGVAADLAATLASHEQIVRLKAAEAMFEEAVRTRSLESHAATSAAGWARANDAFHDIVHEAACNERLRATIASVHRGFPRNLTWERLGSDLRLLRENVAQHRGIREAIESGDGPEARRRMVEHVKRSGELVAARHSRSS